MGAIMNMHEVKHLFLHIPRTGGTSLRKMFESSLSSSATALLYGECITKAEQVLRNIPDKQWDNIELIRGHFTFGIHRWIPRPCAYFTLLREPVARCLSLYKYIRRDPAHSMHRDVMDHSMEWFFTSGVSVEVNCGQVRQLCETEGPLPQKPWGTTPTKFGYCGREQFLEAQNALRQYFVWVGFTEKHEQTVGFLGRYLGWSPVNAHDNRTRPGVSLSPKTRKMVEELNEWDTKLYEYAKGAWLGCIETKRSGYT
jgi:hypothetical protein